MKLLTSLILTLTIILVIKASSIGLEAFEIRIRSNFDNNVYSVQDLNNKEEAANILARLVSRIKRVIQYLKNKYPNDIRVKRLNKRFDPAAIRESDHEDDGTSFTINKGDEIHVCLRNKNTNKTLHEINLLMFVAIHELAHIASKSIGHNQEFMTNFKFLLHEARLAGVYDPVNFRDSPVKYCGLKVSHNPLFST